MEKMCCVFRCPHGFTDNYKDCESMDKPECADGCPCLNYNEICKYYETKEDEQHEQK